MKKIIILCSTLFFILLVNGFSVDAKKTNNDDVIVSEHIDTIKNGKNVLNEAIEEFICKEMISCDINDKITILDEPLYDLLLNKVGYSYEITDKIGNDLGYLILRLDKNKGKWNYAIQEYSIGSQYPFNDKSSKNIYVGYGIYLEYKNNKLVDTLRGISFDYNSFINNISTNELGYFIGASGGSQDEIYSSESVYFVSKTEYTYTFPYGFPTYSTNLNLNVDNNCSPTVGTEIIAFWDRYYSDLIPSFNPTYREVIDYIDEHHIIYGNEHFKEWYDIENPDDSNPYFSSSDKIILEDLHDYLYIEMYTNNYYIPLFGDGSGTYPPFFYDALYNYFSEHGITIKHTDLRDGLYFWDATKSPAADSGGTVDFEEYKSEIELLHPVVFQLGIDPSMDYEWIYNPETDIDFYNNIFYDISDNGVKKYFDKLTFNYIRYTNTAHTVVGYGYKEIDLYTMDFSDGSLYLSDTLQFFIVANGWGGTSYINTDNEDISIAYSVYPS